MSRTGVILIIVFGLGAMLLFALMIIVLLAALLLPAIGSAREAARRAQCASHLSQIGMARMMFEQNMGSGVDSADWQNQLQPYLDGSEVFHCPSATAGENSYGMNSRAHRLGPSDFGTIVALDYLNPVVKVVGPAGDDDFLSLDPDRHDGMNNVLFADGSVVYHAAIDLDPTVCEIHDSLWRPTRDIDLTKPGCEGEAKQ